MNFLAHLFLSGDDPDIMLGNLIADGIKGKNYEHLNKGAQEGILLHRRIDHFTDNHPVVGQSKERLRSKYRKYTGVIVDMFYDHFLAANWKNYSRVELYDFTVKAYELLINNLSILPPRIRRVMPYMLASNWLYSYRDLEMMSRYFEGMAKRTSFYSGMADAVDDLKEHYTLFKGEFETFFPELIHYVESYEKQEND
jgi:acyl carrier protein phosphodiesterase